MKQRKVVPFRPTAARIERREWTLAEAHEDAKAFLDRHRCSRAVALENDTALSFVSGCTIVLSGEPASDDVLERLHRVQDLYATAAGVTMIRLAAGEAEGLAELKTVGDYIASAFAAPDKADGEPTKGEG